MSLAVTALLLLRLEARRGEWVTVAELAAHLALVDTVVRAHLLAMESAGTALLRRGDGGIVQAASAPPQTGRAAAFPPPTYPPTGLERIERPCGAPAGGFQGQEEPHVAA